MRHIASGIVFAALVVLFGAPHARAWDDKECTKATLKGGFGYTGTGALLAAYVGPTDAGPFAEVGRQTFDGKGHTDATATLSANGDISQVTVEGTYTVKSDCTGTMTLNISPFGSTVDLNFVIDEDGKEIRAIVSDVNVIESRVYRRQCPGDGESHVSVNRDVNPLPSRDSTALRQSIVAAEIIRRDFLLT
jgi:hypothetical protein